jgi:hypothetical protein
MCILLLLYIIQKVVDMIIISDAHSNKRRPGVYVNFVGIYNYKTVIKILFKNNLQENALSVGLCQNWIIKV